MSATPSNTPRDIDDDALLDAAEGDRIIGLNAVVSRILWKGAADAAATCCGAVSVIVFIDDKGDLVFCPAGRRNSIFAPDRRNLSARIERMYKRDLGNSGTDIRSEYRRRLGYAWGMLCEAGDSQNVATYLDEVETLVRLRLWGKVVWVVTQWAIAIVASLAAAIVYRAQGSAVSASAIVAIGSLCGAVGVAVSTSTRWAEVDVELTRGLPGVFLDAIIRAFVGVVSALVVQLAYRTRWIAGPMADNPHPLMEAILFGVLAGASERAFRGLLARFDGHTGAASERNGSSSGR